MVIAGAQQRSDVQLVAQKIRDALGLPFQTAKRPIYIAASNAILSFSHDGTTPTALLHAADRALYDAKHPDTVDSGAAQLLSGGLRSHDPT